MRNSVMSQRTGRWVWDSLRRRLSAMSRRRQAGVGLFVLVAIIGLGLLIHGWTTWPAHRVFRERFETSSLALSPDGATLATRGFGVWKIAFRDVSSGRR